MVAQAALEGRLLGGRPPYGYRLTDAGPHPDPSTATDGQRLHQLQADPNTAPVVQRIYREYLAGAVYAIAERLTRDAERTLPVPGPGHRVPGWRIEAGPQFRQARGRGRERGEGLKLRRRR